MAIAWLYFELYLPFVHLSLRASGIRPESGRAYITRIPRPALRDFVRLKTDSPDTPGVSLLQLYEDGHRLGPADSLPDLVRQSGNGAFSQRGRELLFSTSDGSSPLTNQRIYFVRAPLMPTSLLRLLGWIALLTALWRVIVLFPAGARAICRYGDPSNNSLARGAETTWRTLDHIGKYRARCSWRILVLPHRYLGIGKDRRAAVCSGRFLSSQ